MCDCLAIDTISVICVFILLALQKGGLITQVNFAKAIDNVAIATVQY